MKLSLACLCLLAAAASAVRRHRSASYPSEGLFYPPDPGYATFVEKLYPPFRPSRATYFKSSPLNWAGAPLTAEEGGPVLSGSVLGPCGGLSGHIGCGGLGGSLCTPFGSLSGSIGSLDSSRAIHHGPIHGPTLSLSPPPTIHSLPPPDPCGTRIKPSGCVELNESSIDAALVVVEFLIKNGEQIGIFRYPGRADVRWKLQAMLENGDSDGLEETLAPGMVMEASDALRLVIQELSPPLIPPRVEELISAKNDVPNEVIAIDALGLLYEELNGKHLILVLKLLELLYIVSKNSRRTELSTISIAVKLLKVFFHMKKWTDYWQDVSLIFHEMILKSQEYRK